MNLSKMLKKISILFFIFCNIVVSGQSVDLKTFDYSKADSAAINFSKKKYKTVQEIVTPLTEGLASEQEKFRTIFRWITLNIEYNRAAAGVAEADKIIRRNKAVCQGFSSLLKEMCDYLNIPCEIVVGYTKTDINDINKKLKKTDHAWNVEKLGGKWYPVDVTWATSKYNVITRRFIKEFDEHYFLTPPEKFILDHLPKDPKFQLLDKPVKKKKFIQAPIYYTDYFHMNIESISPDQGKIKGTHKKFFRFSFVTKTEIKNAAVLIDYDKFVTPVELKKGTNPNEYYFDYSFQKEGKKDFTIYLNGVCIAEYIIKVR